MTEAFWNWSLANYADKEVESALLALQDGPQLNVNLLLWSLWCATQFGAAEELLVRKAIDLAERWNTTVVTPLRTVRRELKSPRAKTGGAEIPALYGAVKSVELDAEKIEQAMLENLATSNIQMFAPAENGAASARKNLVAYVRLSGRASDATFSVALLDTLITLTFGSKTHSVLDAEGK